MIDAAVNAIGDWAATKSSAELAGLDDTAFLKNRRKVFARINSFAARSSPHERFTRKRMIESARRLAGQTMGCEDERALDDLDLDGGDRMEESPIHDTRPAQEAGGYRLRALLLFVPYLGFRDPTIE
jgi:hypothetical protein